MIKLINDDWYKFAQKELLDNSIDCIITDPPFGVDFNNDLYDDSLAQIEKDMLKWLKEMYRVLKDKSHCYIYVGVKSIHLWITKAIEAGFEFKNIIASKIYESYNYAGGSNFKFNFQPILYLSKGKPKQFNKKVNFFPTSGSWLHDKRNKNPQPYSYSYSSFIDKDVCFSNIKTNKQLKHLHNSEKNVKLLKFFVELSTNPNDLVLDPFMGSGSTGVACFDCGRNFIGVELGSEIYQTTINKFNNLKIEIKQKIK